MSDCIPTNANIVPVNFFRVQEREQERGGGWERDVIFTSTTHYKPLISQVGKTSTNIYTMYSS